MGGQKLGGGALLGFSSDPENFLKIKFVEFHQYGVEFWQNRPPDLEYFRQVRRRYNGVMVTAPEGSSVTVRDRPPNVKDSLVSTHSLLVHYASAQAVDVSGGIMF